MERLSRALSVRQPLIEMILLGTKTWEFRSRQTHIRERVYLYASKALVQVEGFDPIQAAALPRGLIVGSVVIDDCFDDGEGWCWGLARPRRYRVPFKPLGVPQPGFWRPRFAP